ncbi:multidrug resistance protein, MATE family [Moraxella cuniculi DSM 21768]|uniref:Multidrug-efflux transporter n=1 Tax=Moraxella cuniculi DSM 21768 TaxID=1122245 RepID=A0A1N7F7T7_9GAMM|nr:MATE family efflux transporter [Moraxella cuniculi]OOS06404.1 multidrug efflux MATE transporter NorM [Moraxella cuniculi]SIR96380.1 multidrug resistance protein, MATE family [Moraxella cuniculi DSM 21768]
MLLDINRYRFTTYKKELKALIYLAMPMLLAQVAQVGTSFIDTVMAGGAGKADLAAVALGSSVFVTIYITLMGVMTSLNPMIAQLYGAKGTHEVGEMGRQGLWLGLIIGVIGMMLMWLAIEPFRAWLNISPATFSITENYLWFVGLGMPAAAIHRSLNAYAASLNRPKIIMWVSWLCFFLNIPLNWIFVYGKFGLPALGGAGCGLATAIVFWINALALWLLIIKDRHFASFGLMDKFSPPDIKQLYAMIRLGLPIGLSFFIEVSLFTCIMFLVAKLDGNSEDYVAAQQVVISLTSLIFMLPQSFGSAATVRVGFVLGREQFARARYISGVAISSSVVTAVGTALLLISCRYALVGIYTDDIAVIALAASLVLYAAAFQLVDAIQCVASYALRGYKVTTVPMIIHIIAFWGCGLLPGYLLAFRANMGIYGFWTALVGSLSIAAICLLWYLSIHSQKVITQARTRTI